jgi:phage-related baseplate assembly protein
MANEGIPQFVERDPDAIMSECKMQLEELLGRELQPAQAEQLMLQFIVYREVLLLNRFNAAMAQMLYQFGTAPVLDYIAALVAVERLPEARSGCTVRFTLIPGHGQVIIPEGTRVASGDGNVIFATLADASIAPGVNSIDLPVRAEAPGKSGNNYAPGDVNKILDPLAFVSTVANMDITGGGSDVETDEQLRERIKLAPSQYTSAGSHSSYLFYAKSANALIIDVSVSSPVPGTVLIVPLTDEEEMPEQVLTDIRNACNAEKVRPLTDTVIVAPPAAKNYSMEVIITPYAGADSTDVQNEIHAALQAYSQEKRKHLGQDIVRSHISQVCRLASVYDVNVVSPANNIAVENGAFAQCTGITVTIMDSNNG